MKHSTRQAKITLYLDVPTTDDENHFIGYDEIESLVKTLSLKFQILV